MGRKRKHGRLITTEERVQRGCAYCLDTLDSEYATRCKYKACPYHVLDKYKYYEEFLISEESHAVGAIIESVGKSGIPLYPGGGYEWGRMRSWRENKAKSANKEPK